MGKTFKEEIQQKKFKCIQNEAVLNIIYTAGRFDEIIRNALKPFGITPEQYNVLHILKGKYPEAYALQEIRNRMLTRYSNTSRLVEKLRCKDYLTRRPMENNRRKVEIKITEKGRDFLSKVDKKQGSSELFKQGLSDEKTEKLSELIDHFRSNIERHIKEE